jgi:sterol desaturase/sphingolipid hydroxylase (fatty acid hydroxylase superfamily)
MNLVYQFSETKWNLYVSFVLDFLVGVGLLTFAFTQFEFTLGYAIIAIIAGWFTFTLIEYLVHAILFHVGKNVFTKGHGKHHKNPQGYDNLPFFAASLIAFGFYLVLSALIPEVYAIIVTGMVMLSYVAYTWYHFAMHRFDFKNPYGKYMQRFHYVHHIRPKMNHGVTVPIWDMIFGTYEPLNKYSFDADLKARPADNLIRED